MPLADEIKAAIDDAVAKALSKVELRAGTIVLSPSYQVGDPLTVVLDGSAVAVEVKMIRAFNVFPNARVACARVGVDWTAIGVFIDPSQGNIVAGVPDGARFEFDPYAVNMKVYDADGNVVVEIDQTTGVSVYDPQGEPGNRTRIVTESGQVVLSQIPGLESEFSAARLVSTIANAGLANEYPNTTLEGVTYAAGTDFPFISFRGESADDSLPVTVAIVSFGDDLPSMVRIQSDNMEFSGVTSITALFLETLTLNRHCCTLYRSAALTAFTTAVTTVIPWDAEEYDTPGMHSTSVNPSRINILRTGKYQISGLVSFNAHATGSRIAHLRLNSAGNPASGTQLAEWLFQAPATGGHGGRAPFVIERQLTAGDYIEVFGYQNSGGNLAIIQGVTNTFVTVREMID